MSSKSSSPPTSITLKNRNTTFPPKKKSITSIMRLPKKPIRRAQERMQTSTAADVAAGKITSAFKRSLSRIGKGAFGETKLIRLPGSNRMVIAKYFTDGNAERNKIQEEKKHSEVYDVLRRSKTCHSVDNARVDIARICCKDIVVKPLLRGVHPRISLQEYAQKPGTRLLSLYKLEHTFPHLVPAADRALGVAKGCLHAHGFTHKDLHGDNILYLVGPRGVEGIRIIDWGMYGAVRFNKRGGVDTVPKQLNRFVSETMAPGKGVQNFHAFRKKRYSSQGRSFEKAMRAAKKNLVLGNPNVEGPVQKNEVSPYIKTVNKERKAAARKVQNAYVQMYRRPRPTSKSTSGTAPRNAPSRSSSRSTSFALSISAPRNAPSRSSSRSTSFALSKSV